MKITPCPHGFEDIVGQNKPGYLRGKGLHMSDIYGSLFKELEPKRYDTGEPMDLNRLEAGMAFEEFLEEGMTKRLSGERPGELTTEEGILYSPDFLVFSDVTRLGEIKLTWLSSKEVPRERANGFPPQFDKYFCQMMSYCHNLETPYARLVAYFVNGPYKHPYTPELLAWDIEFSSRELRENWQMMMSHARRKKLLV